MSPQIKNFSIVLITSLLVTFSFYEKITLHSFAPGGLWFNKHVEAHRQGHQEETTIEQNDSFMNNQFSKSITTNLSAFSYENLPGYIFYKVFNLQGEDLWLAQKLLISLLNIGSILLVFGITRCLFGEKTAVLSSILCAFSPHIWITFNFDSASLRAYNYFLSLLTVYLYLRYEKKKTLVALTSSGVALGVNFLFFHMGSFSTPIIIATYCFFRSAREKRFTPNLHFLYLFIIGFLTVITLNIFHLTYFKIDQSPLLAWFDWYTNRGSIASHNIEGLVLFDIHRLSENIAFFFNSVFINGLDEDWHYIIAPPGIPLIYSYFIFAFSIPGMYFLFKKKRKENLFLTCWLLFFVLVYSLVIMVRIKNMILLIPPFIILATVGARFSATYLHRSSHKWLPLNLYFKLILNYKYSRKRFDAILTGILLGGSVLTGTYFVFIELPSKNFYGANYIKYREIYKHITSEGYSKNSSIVFTSSQALRNANLALRLLTNNSPRVVNLNLQGLPSPYEVDAKLKFVKINSNLKLTSDKIYYCFISHHNYLGDFYVTDNVYEQLFLNLYPDVTPFVIKGLDGISLWKIYRVAGDHKKS
jgi:4-amino-4-deoxy-L-arabinose transferase-like glycosyltransferase